MGISEASGNIMVSEDTQPSSPRFLRSNVAPEDNEIGLDCALNDHAFPNRKRSDNDLLSEDYKLTSISKAPIGKSLSTTKHYASYPDLRRRAVELVLEGKNPSMVANIFEVWPSIVHYHLDKASKAGEIVYIEGSFPHNYKRGPKYGSVDYKYRGRGRSPQFVNPEARVHLGNGSSYRLKVLKEGDLHGLKLSEAVQPLFPRDPVGRKGEQHFNANLPLPAAIVGREGAKATLVFYPSPKPEVSGGRLEISPPELILDQGQLIAATSGAALFEPIEEYVVYLLSRYGGWRFGDITHHGEEVHFAFSRKIVDSLLPGLMDNPEVHVLRRGEREMDHPLFRDLSVPEGELETTDLRMAQDLLTILTEVYLKLTGAR